MIRTSRHCDFCSEVVKDAGDAMQVVVQARTLDICLKCANKHTILELKRLDEEKR